jgi:hypothetical protein
MNLGCKLGVMAKRKIISPVEMRQFIHSLRGSLKRKPGAKPLAEQMADYNREEKELEEARFVRLTRAGLLPMGMDSRRSK